MNMLTRSIPTLLAGIFATGAFAADVENITIRTLPAQMRYDVSELELRPGQKVKLTFQNDDEMPHNICFFLPGTDVIAVANKQMEKPEEALKRNWLPVDERMWLHSKPVDPKQSDHLEFTVPEEPGVYPYVCTFPGHAAIMNGKLNVTKPGPGLADLKFKLYLGNWDMLPDFSKLKPHREGGVPDNLVQLKLDDYKNEFGVVFTGTLDAPKDGEYFFNLASDDGAALFIDGKQVVNNDKIHPASTIKEGRVKLKRGRHDLRLEYFQAAGEAELFAAWRGPGFSTTPLSKWLHPNWKAGGKQKKKDEATGMPIVVGGEPVIYRNFIAGAGNRGIAVGFPGNANIAWSAEAMNLALAWRGAFIDAARHWNSRGGGYQPPLGYDVFRPAELSPPFAVLSAGATWPVVEKGGRAEGYTWRGYELDAKRHPIFQYEWQGVKVSDRFEVTGDALASGGKLVRTLKLVGKIPAGALFRVASAGKITPQGADFLVEGGRFTPEIATDSRFVVSVEGAKLSGKDLTIPARAEIRVTYSWPNAHGGHAAHSH
jgi:plastocyanin